MENVFSVEQECHNSQGCKPVKEESFSKWGAQVYVKKTMENCCTAVWISNFDVTSV